MNRRRALVMGIAVLVIFAPVVYVAASAKPGCRLAVEPSFGDNSFARVEDRLTTAMHPPLTAAASVKVDLPQLAAAQVMRQPKRTPGSLQLVVGFGNARDPSVIAYYSKDAIDPSATLVDFLRIGGIAYARQPAAAGNAS